MTLKVLIVEDDFIIQMFLEQLILSEGSEVVASVSESGEVLIAIEKFAPDLIFMDIGISGKKNGIEIAQIINETYKIPLVFITGNSDKSTLSKAKKTNPIHILFKPIDDISFAKEFKTICQKIKQ